MTTACAAARAPDALHPPDSQATDDQKWQAWKEKGAAHDRLVNRRLRLTAAVVAGGLACAAVARFLFG